MWNRLIRRHTLFWWLVRALVASGVALAIVVHAPRVTAAAVHDRGAPERSIDGPDGSAVPAIPARLLVLL